MNHFVYISYKEGTAEWTCDTTYAGRIRGTVRAYAVVAAIDRSISRKCKLVDRTATEV